MASAFHSLFFDSAKCSGCMSCLRACPTEAIRVRDGLARMLEDRCIDCGECFKVCPKSAIVPLTDSMANLSRFEYTVAIPSPTLYAQFDPEVQPGVILQALRGLGFDDAVGLSGACAQVTAATEIYLSDYRSSDPLISSFCPAVVRLIQTMYPSLIGQLLPICAPREVAARAIRQEKAVELGLHPAKIGLVYITTCSCKMTSIRDHPGMAASGIDAVIPIRDIFPLLVGAVNRVRACLSAVIETESASGVWWSYLGGLPRSVPQEKSMSVAGLRHVMQILDDIEKGRLGGYSLIECHACPEGCVSGALTVENPYVARARAIRLMRQLPDTTIVDRSDIRRRFEEGWYLWEVMPRPLPLKPLDQDVPRAIAKMKEKRRLTSRLPGIDCGACGAPTCGAFAEDVVLGRAEEDECLFMRIQHMSKLLARLPAGETANVEGG
jgi:iron only hydrogenase large subunit-like protein